MSFFTHVDDKGRIRMVDVTKKKSTDRMAIAQGIIAIAPDTFNKIRDHKIKKGNVIETARVAGIMAAKKTQELIPMCHPLLLTHVKVDFYPDDSNHSIKIIANVRLFGQTGVEMEALTAVSVAALTIYDMCKAYDKNMFISDIFLIEKKGGKSGHFVHKKN